jgi:opacity protein-like surface antigen
MHHTKVALSAALALATAVSAGAVGAQGTRPFSLGVSGGLSVPTGDTGDGLNAGFNVAGHLGLQSSALPIGLRFDLAYNRWDLESVDASFRSLAGIANVMLNFPRPSGSTVRPYVSGGLGLYNTKVSRDFTGGTFTSDGETDVGLNVGAGLDFALSGLSTFVEARFHTVFVGDVGNVERSNLNFVPVVFGIRF